YEIFWFLFSFLLSTYFAFFIEPEQKINFILMTIGYISLGSLFAILFLYLRYGKRAISLFQKYYSKISFVQILGTQAEVQKELRDLLKTWEKFAANEPIILFVDDIDRCPENKIIQIVDALRVMLDDSEISKKVIVVTAL